MPANLPPEYFIVEARLKEAKNPEEKVALLERLLALTPKHKGTERVQKDLKTKIAKFKKISGSKKGGQRESLYYVPKEGAGQIVITGPTNSGKSSLLNALTNARAKVDSYPFVTKVPQPAMMPFEDILIQLVDTPSLTKEFSPPWLREILASSDGLLVVFDLAKPEEISQFLELLANLQLKEKKMILLANKIDLPEAKENFEKIKARHKEKIRAISCLKKQGLEDLKQEIFQMLEIVRVYSKKPNRPPDFSHPFTFKKGTTLLELAREIHHDFAVQFKYARLYRKNLKTPLIVGKNYYLKDDDVIEVHS